jgi:dynein heavy chain
MQKMPSVVAFDDRLQSFYKIMDEVGALPMTKVQDCIKLHMEPLAASVKDHAKQWIDCYGKLLVESARFSLFSLRDELDVSIEMKSTLAKKTSSIKTSS